jgi:DNA-binding CsgD family transcriptional regulator
MEEDDEINRIRERDKELACLYKLSELVEQRGNDLKAIITGLVEFLPESLRRPEKAYAQLEVRGRRYATDTIGESGRCLKCDLLISDNPVGFIEVGYMENPADLEKEIFLEEERRLLAMIAERLSRIIERIENTNQLEVERAALNNMNITLKEVLERVNEEKKETAALIQSNINKVVLPILDTLMEDSNDHQLAYLTLLRNNLMEIADPLTEILSRQFSELTLTEIQICNMIKSGHSTKEIAQLRNLAVSTVNKHREHIRKKLGIANRKVNLATYLVNEITVAGKNRSQSTASRDTV